MSDAAGVRRSERAAQAAERAAEKAAEAQRVAALAPPPRRVAVATGYPTALPRHLPAGGAAQAWQTAQLLAACCGGDVGALMAALGCRPLPPPPSAAEVQAQRQRQIMQAAISSLLAQAAARAAAAAAPPPPPPPPPLPAAVESQLMALLAEALRPMQAQQAQQQQQQAPAPRPVQAPAPAQPAPPPAERAVGTMRRRKRHRITNCQVEGCVAELHPDEEGRNYNYRYRLCEPHMRASAVPFQGQQQRFCQKCSRFHPLAAYNGEMRTCAEKLALQMQRRRARALELGLVPRANNVRRSDMPYNADEAADASGDTRADAEMMSADDDGGEAATASPSGEREAALGDDGEGAAEGRRASPSRERGLAARAHAVPAVTTAAEPPGDAAEALAALCSALTGTPPQEGC